MAQSALALAPDDPLAAGDPTAAAMIESFQEGQRETAESQKQKHALIDPQIADVRRDIATRSKVGAAVPDQKPTPEPPNPQVTMEAAGTWLAAATVMGALAGAMTRRGTTNALAAFTGALEGFKEGNQQKFQQNLQYWQAQEKKNSADNKAAMDKYEAILRNKNLDITQKTSNIGLQAQQFQDDVVVNAASRKEFITLMGLLDQRRQHQEQMDIARSRITETFRHNQAMEGAGNEQINEKRASGIAKYQLPPVANPRNPQDRAVMARVLELNPDYKATKYSGQQSFDRTAGSMGARVETASDELEQVVPQALETSRAFPRGKFVPLNAIKQLIAKGTSNPQYNDFLLANNAVFKAYGRAMNPQGIPRVSEMMEAKAEGILSIQTSPQAYETQLRRLMMEVAASKRAISQVREGGVSPQQGATPATGGGDFLEKVKKQLPPGFTAEYDN